MELRFGFKSSAWSKYTLLFSEWFYPREIELQKKENYFSAEKMAFEAVNTWSTIHHKDFALSQMFFQKFPRNNWNQF